MILENMSLLALMTLSVIELGVIINQHSRLKRLRKILRSEPRHWSGVVR